MVHSSCYLLLPPPPPPLRPPPLLLALDRPRLLEAEARLPLVDLWKVFELLGARAVGCRVVVGREMLELRSADGDLFDAEGSVPALCREPLEGRFTEGRLAGSVATPPPADWRDSILDRAASRLAEVPTDSRVPAAGRVAGRAISGRSTSPMLTRSPRWPSPTLGR
jgi:hypothetical protein